MCFIVCRQNCWGETEPDITIKSKLASEFILERAQTFPRQVRKIKPSNCKRKKVKLHFYNEYEKSFSSKKGTSPELECTSFSQDEDSVVKNSISGNVYNIPRECWIYKGKYSRLGTSAVQFDNFAMEVFPESFYWLLKECARVIGQPIRDLYHEMMIVQNYYVNFKF